MMHKDKVSNSREGRAASDRQIKIMIDEPSIVMDGVATKIPGKPGALFRLLVLSDGRPVRNETITQMMNTHTTVAAGRVRDLRNALARAGCSDLVVSDPSVGYHAVLDGWQVDAKEFKRTIEQIDSCFSVDSTQAVSEADASMMVDRLKQTLDAWQSHPGSGFLDYDAKFTALKEKAERCRINARMLTRDPEQLREAVQELEAIIRRPDAPEEWVWRHLLLAHDALGNVGHVHHALERININYKGRGRIPPKLEALMQSVGAGEGIVNRFRPEALQRPAPLRTNPAPEELIQNDVALHVLCSTLGITSKSQLKLEGSHLEPLACIKRTRTRLYFSGVLASKWVSDRSVRTEFRELLTRLDANGGEAKFLMIDPNSEAFQRLLELRNGALSLESVDVLRTLMARHKSLEVRAYDTLPSFRIVVIDDDVVSFSPYRLAAAAYAKTDCGWEAPHVALDPQAPYPLAEAFELLFLETWRNATDLKDIK